MVINTTMITPSFGLTATERVLPRLALDFTTASLDPRVTFTRTGDTATVVNSSGYVVSITADLPRFDHNPITLICKGLLIEESRTNSLTYSQDFRNTADAGETRPWVYGRVTLSADVVGVTSPDGLNTADQIIEDTQTGFHLISRSATITAGTTQTLSLFYKANGRTTPQINFRSDSFANGFIANFNLTTVTSSTSASGTGTVVSSSIEAYPNGWFRLTVTGTLAPAATTGTIQFSLGSYTGDGTSGAYFWGAQLEAGAFPTSYIPTTTTALTRNADVATMTGTNFSDWYNASEGTFVAKGITNGTSVNDVIVSANDNSTNNMIDLRIVGTQQVQTRYVVNTSGVAQVDFISSSSYNFGNTRAISFSYKVNNFYAAYNGSVGGADTSGTIPSVNQLQIGYGAFAGSQINGWVSKVFYYPQSLTNSESLAFTK